MDTPRRRVLIVIGALMLAMLLAALDQTIVSTALPTIVGDLGGLNHLSWVVTSYLLAITVVTPLYGKLGDLYGRKVVLQGALVLFLIGSALCGLVVAVAFLLAWMLQERPLRRTIEDTDLGDAFAPPQDTDSLREITRELSRMVGRERTRRFIEGVTEEAELELAPAEAWLLGRATDGAIPAETLLVGDAGDQQRLAAGVERLREEGLVAERLELTSDGRAVREQLLVARQRRLAGLVADWEPEGPEIDEMVRRLAAELEVRAG